MYRCRCGNSNKTLYKFYADYICIDCKNRQKK